MIPVPFVILRECRQCGWRGPLTGFHKAKTNRFGRTYLCFGCSRANAKKQYDAKRSPRSENVIRCLPPMMLPEELGMLRECNKCGWRGPLMGFAKNRSCYFNRALYCFKCDREKRNEKFRDWLNSLDSDARALRNELLREQYHKRMADPTARGKARKRSRETQRKLRQNPEYKAEQAAKQRVRRNKNMRDPEYRESYNRYHRDLMRARYHSDPEFKAKERKRAFERRMLISQEEYELNDVCEYCGSSEDLSADHIVPFVFIERYGIAGEIIGSSSNIATACRSCNSSKNDRIPIMEPFLSIAGDLLDENPKEMFDEKCFWIGVSFERDSARL